MGGHVTAADHYDYAIDPNGDSTPNKVLRWVGQDRRVLELGTAAGVMTRAMKDQGCTITGIEYVPAMAERAAPYCERMIVGDLDQMDLAATLGDTRFDVLVAADVLEHLRDPWRLLEQARRLIAPGGHAVLSIPNIGHAAVIAGLMGGRFDYRDKGLLDRTHLRFFTRVGIEDMLLATGWLPVAWESHRVPPLESEFATHWLAQPASLRQAIERQPDSDIYQFIIKAVPASEVGWQQSMQEGIHRREAQLQASQLELARLKDVHEATLDKLREHQQAFAEAKDWIAQLQQEKAELLNQLDERDKMLAQARVSLEQLTNEHHARMAELSRFKRGLSCLWACANHWLRGKARD